MKTFLDWIVKTMTGAIAAGIFLAVSGVHFFPLPVPLLTVGGRNLVLNMPDAIGLIVFVLLAATGLYMIGYCIWKAISFLWSKF